jgi:1-acyl-sn-glycerol-3-phosphate acyltransferase
MQVPIQPVVIWSDPPVMGRGAKWYQLPREFSRVRIRFLEPIPAPKKGTAADLAREVEELYKKLLHNN